MASVTTRYFTMRLSRPSYGRHLQYNRYFLITLTYYKMQGYNNTCYADSTILDSKEHGGCTKTRPVINQGPYEGTEYQD